MDSDVSVYRSLMFKILSQTKNISAKVRGCALCEASAGLVVKIFKDKHVPIINFLNEFRHWLNDENSEITSYMPNELEVFLPIKTIKNRHTCVIMPFEAIIKTLDELKMLK